MNNGLKTIIFPAKDATRAKALYRNLLEVDPYVDQPYYVGFRVGDQELGLDPNGHAQGMSGPVGYWHVDDIQSKVQSLLDAGGQVQSAVRNVGGGRLIATVKDSDGNLVGLLQDPKPAS